MPPPLDRQADERREIKVEAPKVQGEIALFRCLIAEFAEDTCRVHKEGFSGNIGHHRRAYEMVMSGWREGVKSLGEMYWVVGRCRASSARRTSCRRNGVIEERGDRRVSPVIEGTVSLFLFR